MGSGLLLSFLKYYIFLKGQIYNAVSCHYYWLLGGTPKSFINQGFDPTNTFCGEHTTVLLTTTDRPHSYRGHGPPL